MGRGERGTDTLEINVRELQVHVLSTSLHITHHWE